jgi:integrase
MSKKRTRGNGEGSIFKRQDGGPWYIRWYDNVGKRREHCTKTTDKTTAQRILADKLADVALRREGIIDTRQEAIITEGGKPIEKHLADFEAMMKARQGSDAQVKRTLFFIREVCTAAGFERPTDITADGLNRIMANMKAEKKAARTIQGRVVAMKAFTRWLADHAKLSHDPLRSVKRPSVTTDRRLRRRMLTPNEWPCLRAATLASGPRDGMNPREPVALYAVAIQTGLRQNELRSVTKADLFLAGEKP